MTTLGSTGYQIGGSTRRCAATGRELAVGERVMTALVERIMPDGERVAERLDFAEDAWDGGARPTAGDAKAVVLVGAWRSTVPEPNAKRRQLLSDDELLDLFEQLATGQDDAPESETPGDTSDDPAARRSVFRYLLCLILMRKKLIVCDAMTPADPARGVLGRLTVRRRGKAHAEDEPWTVTDPGLGEEAIASAAVELSEVLDLDDGGG